MAKFKGKGRRKHLLPDQFHQGPTTVVAPMPAAQGGVLKGTYKYVLETWRTDGKWQVNVQWIEVRTEGLVPMVVELPHEVVERIFRQREAILKESRRLGAKKAHETAAAKTPD